MPPLIINADDFGISSEVNAAILESFNHGWCSSSTLMPNMEGTEEAAQLTVDHRLTNHIGLHLVLDDQADPLSEDIKKIPRFCDSEGRLSFSRRSPTFRLDTSEKAALAKEIRAQIDRCRGLGVPLTHIDSHHHVHTEWAIGKVLIQVAKEKQIRHLRLSRNAGSSLGFVKRTYKGCFNWRVRRAGLARTQFFVGLRDYVNIASDTELGQVPTIFEVMVHPGFDETGNVINYDENDPLGDLVTRIKGFAGAESFSGHRYSPN